LRGKILRIARWSFVKFCGLARQISVNCATENQLKEPVDSSTSSELHSGFFSRQVLGSQDEIVCQKWPVITITYGTVTYFQHSSRSIFNLRNSFLTPSFQVTLPVLRQVQWKAFKRFLLVLYSVIMAVCNKTADLYELCAVILVILLYSALQKRAWEILTWTIRRCYRGAQLVLRWQSNAQLVEFSLSSRGVGLPVFSALILCEYHHKWHKLTVLLKSIDSSVYISVAEIIGVTSPTLAYEQLAEEATDFDEISQNNRRYAAQGHSRSSEETAHWEMNNSNGIMIYGWLLVQFSLSRGGRGCLPDAVVGAESLHSWLRHLASTN